VFELFEGRMNAARFIEFCRHLLEDVDTPVFLILDGSSVHKAHALRDYAKSTEGRLTIFILPPYSPQLNPDEWVWRNVKNGHVARTVVQSWGELYETAMKALERLRRTPEIVRAFFADPCTIVAVFRCVVSPLLSAMDRPPGVVTLRYPFRLWLATRFRSRRGAGCCSGASGRWLGGVGVVVTSAARRPGVPG